jgi:hypothetical protein
MPKCHPQYILITPDAIQSHGYDEVELINEALNAYLRIAEGVLETHKCKDCILALAHGKLLEAIKQINTFVEEGEEYVWAMLIDVYSK